MSKPFLVSGHPLEANSCRIFRTLTFLFLSFRLRILSFTLTPILPMSQLQTQWSMTSRIRSRIEYFTNR